MKQLAEILSGIERHIAQNSDTIARDLERERRREWFYALRDVGLPAMQFRLVTQGRDVHGNARVSSKAYLAARERLSDGKKIIVLGGQPGTGKTCAMSMLLSENLPAKWVSAERYAAIPRWDEKRLAIYEAIKTLGIDDAGLEEEKHRGHIECLICDRYADDALTILTTNLHPKKFIATYNERVVSRIRERGCFVLCDDVIRPGEKKQ